MLGMGKLTTLVLAAAVFSGGAVMGALTVQNILNASADGGVDYGLDVDGNGLYDYLVVEMPIKVETAGYYNAHAQLTTDSLPPSDCFGDVLMPGPWDMDYPISYAYVRVFMDVTDDTIKIAFEGEDINNAGVDGPYKVTVYVYRDDEDLFFPQEGYRNDYLTPPEPWVYITQAYSYTDFEEASWAIRFTGSHTDQGVDVNDNGLYEYLRVSSEVRVELAGHYMISAMIMLDWNEPPQDPRDPIFPYPFIYFSDMVELEVGTQIIDFDLPGGDIRESGVDGPYDVYLMASYTFRPYPNETDPRVPEPPPIIEWPVIPWPNMPGIYPPEQGFDYYSDSDCHTTQAYTHDQFEEPPPSIVFTGEFADYGEDWNGNGLYEELVVEAGVEVFQPGLYEVRAVLSVDSIQITYFYDLPYLDVGEQTLYIRFWGQDIEASGLDGPYDVTINVMRVQRPIDPEATYTTSAYTHDQFEGCGGNGTRMYWISAMEVRTAGDPPEIIGAAAVEITRGSDLLPYVIEDIVILVIEDSAGTVVFSGESPFSIPGGGISVTVSFTFTLQEHGDYTATAYLTSMEDPTDVMQVTFTA